MYLCDCRERISILEKINRNLENTSTRWVQKSEAHLLWSACGGHQGNEPAKAADFRKRGRGIDLLHDLLELLYAPTSDT